MSADALRRAAALMRERAEAVSKSRPSPWWVLNPDDELYQSVWYGDEAKVKGIDAATVPEDEWDAIYETSSSLDNSDWDPPLAQHIAPWHPAVAVAVAELLDDFAERVENAFDPAAFAELDGGARKACDLARTYLGEIA